MITKHTAGPWAVNWAGSGKNGQIVYDEVYVYAPACGVEDVAVAADIADPLTGEPSVENARLIAAAPDLLDALDETLKTLLAWVGHYSDREPSDLPAVVKAIAAIAKATGEAS